MGDITSSGRPRPFNRPPRVTPQLPTTEVVLPTPPSGSERPSRSWSALLPPLVTSGMMVLVYGLVRGGSGGSLLLLIPMAAMAVITAVISAVQLIRERRRQAQEERRRQQEYRTALETTTRQLTELDAEQRQVRRFLDPELDTLLMIADVDQGLAGAGPQPRLWERRPEHRDFLTVRIGLGPVPTTVKIKQPTASGEDAEIRALSERFQTVTDVPLTLGLNEVGSVGIAGAASTRTRFAQALIWRLLTYHSPSDVRIAAIFAPDRTNWSWLRWPPHTLPLNGDTYRRMIAVTDQQAEDVLISLLDELSRRRERGGKDSAAKGKVAPLPHLILLIDGYSSLQRQTAIDEIMRHGREYGITAMIIVERWDQVPGDCGAMIDVAGDASGRYALADGQWVHVPRFDQADLRQSDALGRALAGVALAEGGANQEVPRSVRLLDLLGIADAADLAPPAAWSRIPTGAWHADAPIGQGAGGVLVHLDLREHHHGPHGIIAGATGAGKSELLQAIIASLAITHAPDRAQFLLIDFKGGASLRIFQHLPHTVGMVTDLNGRMAERAITAIKSEIRRRKELLNSVDVKDIAAYRALAQPPESLANLLIVIDEFDEMVKEQPDFVKELIRVVKQGRSLGVHLLLATQQPARAVKDEIKTQLQYWIALRLGSAEDSREMLQRPDAFFLPTGIPGRAYMRVGTDLTLFQAPRVSGSYRPRSEQLDRPAIFAIDEVGQVKPLEMTQPRERSTSSTVSTGAQQTDLDVIAAQLAASGGPYAAARRSIWCPPLPARLTLEHILPSDLIAALHMGCLWTTDIAERWIKPYIGLLDIPQESRQEAACIELQNGHVLIAGAPGSGKTVLLRTLLMSLALSHSPADLWCYLIDAGGQGLNDFRTMPHVGELVQVREVERVRRMLWLINRELQQRQAAFRAANAADLPSFRRETGQRLPAILLVIDKFALFREEHEALMDDLIALVRVGRSYGIHLIITADRPLDISYRLLGLLETRFVLRLTDEGDSTALMSKRLAAQIPADLPGRGYCFVTEQGWLEFQVALPYVERGTVVMDEHEESANNLLDAEVNANVRTCMERLQLMWQSMPNFQRLSALAVRLLPDMLSFEHLWTATHAQPTPDIDVGCEALLGLEGQTIEPARIRFNAALPGCLVVGGPRSGKTIALRTMVLSLARRYSPEQLRIALVDPRNASFRDLRMLPHVAVCATNETELAVAAEELNIALERATGTQRWLVCIDDYDLCTSLMTNQFTKPFGVTTKTFVMVLESLTSLGRDRGFMLFAGANLNIVPPGVLTQLNASRTGLIMRPNDFPVGTVLLGVKLPIQAPGGQPPVGRGLLVVEGTQQWAQVALPTAQDIQILDQGGKDDQPADLTLHSTLV